MLVSTVCKSVHDIVVHSPLNSWIGLTCMYSNLIGLCLPEFERSIYVIGKSDSTAPNHIVHLNSGVNIPMRFAYICPMHSVVCGGQYRFADRLDQCLVRLWHRLILNSKSEYFVLVDVSINNAAEHGKQATLIFYLLFLRLQAKQKARMNLISKHYP